jgi:acyl-CoA thioesterase I
MVQANGRRRVLAASLGAGLAPAWLMLAAGCGVRAPLKGRPVPAGARVLALGDSLTHGTGTDLASAYPAVLAQLTGWDVVNAGVPGDTSAQALARLPALLEQHRPALVLLGIGGNDLLRRQPEDALRDNIRRIVSLAQTAESQVLLIAVPRPTIASRVTASLDDHPLYGELSEALKVPLHRRGWSDVLQDPALRSDEIHANAEGYRQFAQGLLATLQAAGFKR